MDEPNGIPPSPLSALTGVPCQEASIHSRETYIPCGAQSSCIVWHAKDKRAYPMCGPCGWHNVRNRRGRLLMFVEGFPHVQ